MIDCQTETDSAPTLMTSTDVVIETEPLGESP